MKRFYLALAMLAALPAAASAQTILNEGFETTSTDLYSPNFPDGWSTVDSYTGNNDRYRWNVYYYEKGTMTGTHCASVDSPMFTGGEDGGEGPREEILLTPELNLDNTYQLSFDWMAASKAAIDEGKYDFQVRIVTDGNVEGAETIWSFNNATQLKENGNVPYPWTAWTPYKTMIDLSKWQGKSIKVAFVYKMLKATANVLDIDNVVVKQFTPATGPKGVLSKKQYNFGEVYMDSKMFSDVITLKNEGKSGLKITSIDYPQGVGSTIDPAVVDLDANASLDFKLSYTAALTTPQSGYVTLHTTGGDLQIKVLATKVALPDGYTFEGFENGCPPAGWTGNGWKASNYSIEGDYTAYASVTLDGGEWHQLAVLSDNSDDRYWYLETVNLAAYAGKTVTFRWRYVGHDYDNAKGVGLDLITVTTSADTKASFNATDWNAGTVNYYKTVNSTPKFSVINEGSTALTIKSAKFSTENFSTDLAAGTTLEPKKGAAFSITFSALNAEAQVNDNLVVEFDGGYSISMPVTGLAMAADSHYYDFENDTPGALAPEGFTTIDVDRQLTKPMTGMNYPQRGAATAFTVQQNSDWNGVLDPVSGNQTLVAIASQDESSTVDDWLISQQLTATDKSKFHFYARNWESTLAINPCAQSCVEVLVSTTDNNNTASFTSVMPTTTMPYFNKETWEHYTVDLSKYAGQKIYVAVRHTVKDGLAAFFDDFYFEHFTNFGGVDNVNADNKVTVYPNPVASTLFVNGADADSQISIYNAAGSLVANVVGSQANVDSLAPGVYVVRVATANGIATTRIIKK